MPRVETRQNVMIRRDLNDGGQWYERININFIPDEMIVRTVAYHNDGSGGGMSYIWTNLVPENFIGCFSDGGVNSSGQVFNVNRDVRGQFEFQVRGVDDSIETDRVGDLIICLEFVKYKPERH
jgi:hypothetical protein